MTKPDPSTVRKTELARGALSYLISRLRGKRAVLVFFAFIAMMSAAYLNSLLPVILGNIVNRIADAGVGATFDLVVPMLILIVSCVVGRELFTWIRKFLIETVATRIEREEFVGVIGKLLRVDLSFMISQKIGALHTRIERSIQGIVKLVKLTFLDFLPQISFALMAIVAALQYNAAVPIIMLIVFILTSLITYAQVSSQKGIRLQLFAAKEAIGGKMNELLNGIGFVRAAGLVQTEIDNSAGLAEAMREKEMRHHKWMMTFDGMKQVVEGGGFLAVIAYAAYQSVQGSLQPGDVVALALLYERAAQPLRELHRIVDEGYEAIMKVRELSTLRALPTDRGLEGTKKPAAQLPDTTIAVDRLSVYLSGPEGKATHALRGVTLEIPEGQVVGIAGESGSGKSTLASTLLGLISNYEGHATISGVELVEWDKESLATLIGYVPQNPFVLAGTVRENVCYGQTNGRTLDDATIWAALEDAQLADRVRALPGELNATISEAGRNLSGGEKQRLALARLFLRDSRILVLDEATSALDNVNEARIQKAIERLAGGRTIILIAHRLSTLRAADRVLVFQEGDIVEDGTYDELVAIDGVFSELVRKQEREEDNAAESTV